MSNPGQTQRSAQSRARHPARKARRHRPLIQVDPEDLKRREDESLGEKIKGEAKNGVPGLLVSLGVHAVILIIMWIIVVSDPVRGDFFMDASWLNSAQEVKGVSEGDNANDKLGGFVAIETKSGVGETKQPKTTTNPNETPNSNVVGQTVKPAEVKGILDGRNRRLRNELREELGGNEKAEQAVSLGLGWLLRMQSGNGSWQLHEGYPDAGYSNLRTATGATSLALLAFLGDGHTHHEGDYKEQVHKALEWLKGVQKPNGDFHDHTELGRNTAFYAHAQATIAVCEALIMTGDDSLKDPAQRAVDFLVESQQPVKGGWKYQPQDEKSHGDLSVTGWVLMALHTARAAGLNVPKDTFQLSSRFLDTVSESDRALYKYEETDPPDRVTAALTAQGILCRQFLGWDKDNSDMELGINYLLKPQFHPKWEPGKRNVYHWYYATHTLHNMGGEEWKEWYARVQAAMLPQQMRTGPKELRGSWNPAVEKKRTGEVQYGDPHEYAQKAGRLYITCICLLTLEAPYRHRPLYED